MDRELKLDFVDGEARVLCRLEHFLLLLAAQVLVAKGVVFVNELFVGRAQKKLDH